MMSEKMIVDKTLDKHILYEHVIKGVENLLCTESNLIANLANTVAVLKETFDWWWVGFYLLDGDTLVLGPFQGPLACTRIGFGKGVCGTSWKRAETVLVPDVTLFQGHIACSSESISEIVVPILDQYENVIAVLDVDSEKYNHFDHTDKMYLEKLARILAPCF